MSQRSATLSRVTRETSIDISLRLDEAAAPEIATPIPFLSHMLEQLGRHSGLGLSVQAQGDVHIDGHHTTEDIGITLGQTLREALGDKAGLRRYGWATLPMDEACVSCALDLSGRAFYVGGLHLPKAQLGSFDCELVDVFFEGFARGAAANVHVHKICGDNLHHIIEISFKALAKALRAATRVDDPLGGIPSTKGSLEG